jgi:ABC-type oligopeptide transport system ATPase subunit
VTSNIAVMRQGRIVEQGTREQLFSNAQHEYTRELMAAIPSTDPVAERARRAAARRQAAA